MWGKFERNSSTDKYDLREIVSKKYEKKVQEIRKKIEGN